MESNNLFLLIQEIKNKILIAQTSESIIPTYQNQIQKEIINILEQISLSKEENIKKLSNQFALVNEKCSLDSFFSTNIVFSFLANRMKCIVFQNNLEFKNLSNQLDHIKQMIKNYLNLSNPKFFSFQSTAMRNKKQYLGKKAYQKLRFFLLYIETLLQQTANLSQIGKHREALEKASECFNKLKVN